MQRQFVGSLIAGLAVLAAVPATAFAQAQAYTAAPTVLRAGPGTDYPEVTQLPGGIPVTVMGCISGYSWCDVAMPDLRGWVYAGRLVYPYEGQNVPLLNYGAVIGFPIVGFAIGSYWDNYYRGRPWYNQRDRWERRPPGPGWRGGPGPEFHGGPRPEYHGPGPGFQGGPRPGEGFHGGGPGPRPEFQGGRPGPQPGGHEGGGPRPGGGHEGGGPPQGGGGHEGGGRPQGGGGGGGHGGGERPGGGGPHGG